RAGCSIERLAGDQLLDTLPHILLRLTLRRQAQLLRCVRRPRLPSPVVKCVDRHVARAHGPAAQSDLDEVPAFAGEAPQVLEDEIERAVVAEVRSQSQAACGA